MNEDPNKVVKLYSRMWGIFRGYEGAQIIRTEQVQEYNSYVEELGKELRDDLTIYKVGEEHFNDPGNFYLAEPFKACIEGLLAYLRTKVPTEAIERIGYPT